MNSDEWTDLMRNDMTPAQRVALAQAFEQAMRRNGVPPSRRFSAPSKDCPECGSDEMLRRYRTFDVQAKRKITAAQCARCGRTRVLA